MALPQGTWTVSINKFPSMSCVQRILLNATSDDAMAVVRVLSKDPAVIGTVSASNTDWTDVSVVNPDDPYAIPIFEGSILDMGEALVPGTYFATQRNDGQGWRNEYIVENDGTVWHRMR